MKKESAWRMGRPPKDGDYFIEHLNEPGGWLIAYHTTKVEDCFYDDDEGWILVDDVKWQGPLEPLP